MATDPTVIGNLNVNGLPLCVTDWSAEEQATENDTSSTCDGDGQSSDMSAFKLVITCAGFFSDSKHYHDPGTYNIKLNEAADVEAFIGPDVVARKYSMTDGKVMAWKTDAKIKDKVKFSATFHSQGPRSTYSLPTT